MSASRIKDKGRRHITGPWSMLMRLACRNELGNGSEAMLTEKAQAAEFPLFLRVVQHLLTTQLPRGFPRDP